MVLPQGEFRRFLMADSKERRIILETLFKTQAYRKLEEALDARAKALKKTTKKQPPKRLICWNRPKPRPWKNWSRCSAKISAY
ncbi:hypothetical protein M5E89_10835 [Acidaminococcus intestini]|nr:hypothetical protein M5E89_10835 [Acidaminococcus intestini]